uniref:Putative ovule protein n=1 Tax=Solanum chacoense TaxID=4108 RepID=A0A0V0HHH9_SOLCH
MDGCVCGYARRDMIKNEDIQDKEGVTSVEDKMRKASLRWFGHCDEKMHACLVRRCKRLVVDEFRRARDRPKKH